jgi:hypothetical protein
VEANELAVLHLQVHEALTDRARTRVRGVVQAAAGPLIDGVQLLEEAADNPATKQYLDILKKYGGDPALLGQQAASAFLLWATAAKACGAELTRACVLGHLAKVHEWTGGGLHATTDPGANLPGKCAVVLRLDGTRWVRWKPTRTGSYDCADDHVQRVTGPVVDRADLDANRVSTRFSTG